MEMNFSTNDEGENEKSGTSTAGKMKKGVSSVAEAHKLLIDHLRHEREF